MSKSTENLSELSKKYIESLNEKEYKAYKIAKDHLNDSFQIEKSNGFLTWKKETQKN
jgi:hypothetical protein